MILPAWYPSQRDALPKSAVEALQQQRDAAHQYCMQQGLPNHRSAYWQYTDLAAWLHPDESMDALPALLSQTPMQNVVFGQEGIDLDALSLQDGITCHDLSQDESFWPALASLYDLEMRDGMSAMNWALSRGVYWLRIPAHTKVQLPLALMHRLAGRAQACMQWRLFIEVGEGSELSVFESYEGEAHNHWYQVHTDWHVHEGATVHWYQQQCLAGGRCALTHRVHQAKHSTFHAGILQMGANHARSVLENLLMGEQAQCRVLGITNSKGQQQHELVVRSKHHAKDTQSHVQHRALVDDSAQSAFNDKVLVANTAPGSCAHQSNQNMVLSEKARAHSKPALEIYHDDVVCSHGATVGALSAEAMFFLRSRGITELQAREILIEAFCQAIIDQLWEPSAQQAWQMLLQQTACHDAKEELIDG